ncbi:hypothetical protein ABOM_001577 [Aspergillus bombycis]|uniref:Uncharacterized protein n=1 Tax=Aspergillus bombycis TaxID=109264 RepID=A0A1F8AEL6_9EURO|nr:hypothetical protein ABOM_001577 [Aspergillus bombycis]OGM49778.1 hypothetical protein ABOM_001577 [Aspergillus bombycis]
MKASVVLLCVFAAFVAATEGDTRAADSTTTAAPALRSVAPPQPIRMSDLTPEETSFFLQYWREHLAPPGEGVVMPGGWKWPAKRDESSQAEVKWDPELSKLTHAVDALPKPQGKITHYFGEQLQDKGESNEDNEDDDDDSADDEDTSPSSPLEKRKQNPCKRGCRADFHCCSGDKCFYGVCLGPQKPPRDVKREIYEFYASVDQTKNSGENDD